jgi:arylsulfatase A-like enzyme
MKTLKLAALVVTAITPKMMEAQKPNILFILTDQQSFRMMKSNDYLKTPAADKIAQNGYTFNKSYCANPVSEPSRFSLMTGRYGSEIGLRENNVAVDTTSLSNILTNGTLGSVFKTAGYDTYFSGKVHLPFTSATGNTAQKLLADYDFTSKAGFGQRMTGATSTKDLLIARKKTDKPLFMFVNQINPHDICFVTNSALNGGAKPANCSVDEWNQVQEVIAQYKALSDSAKTAQTPPLAVNYDPVNDEPAYDAEMSQTDIKFLRTYSWCYQRLTEIVDTEINVILDGLAQSAINDNTIVVFSSDHGDMNGSHRKVSKNRFYEESARIPFIFWGPGIPKGIVDNQTLACNGVDLLPTLCDLCGITKPTGLTGISLKPQLINGATPIQKRNLMIESNAGYMILDGQYKYGLYDGEGNNELLIDTKADSLETRNLINDVNIENKGRPKHKTNQVDVR